MRKTTYGKPCTMPGVCTPDGCDPDNNHTLDAMHHTTSHCQIQIQPQPRGWFVSACRASLPHCWYLVITCVDHTPAHAPHSTPTHAEVNGGLNNARWVMLEYLASASTHNLTFVAGTLNMELMGECGNTVGFQPFSMLYSVDALLDFARRHGISVVTEISPAVQVRNDLFQAASWLYTGYTGFYTGLCTGLYTRLVHTHQHASYLVTGQMLSSIGDGRASTRSRPQ